MGAVTDAVNAALTAAEKLALGDVKIGGAIADALLRYSEDFPRELAELCAVDGAGVVTLPADWVEGWSNVTALGYPVEMPNSGNEFWCTAAETITAGQPVYITGAGLLALAHADAEPRCNVVGVCIIGAVAGVSAVYTTDGSLSLADWTDLAGMALLTPGQTYWLDNTTAGLLRDSPPNTGYIVSVGVAMNATTLNIEISEITRL